MIDSTFLLCLAIGSAAVVIGPILVTRSNAAQSRALDMAALVLPVVCLGLFYSLAVHMHRELGGWPQRIGIEGFSEKLVQHADVAGFAFGGLLLGFVFVWPVVLLLCMTVPKMRPALRYLGVHGAASVAAFAVMMMAPGPFLYWWWD